MMMSSPKIHNACKLKIWAMHYVLFIRQLSLNKSKSTSKKSSKVASLQLLIWTTFYIHFPTICQENVLQCFSKLLTSFWQRSYSTKIFCIIFSLETYLNVTWKLLKRWDSWVEWKEIIFQNPFDPKIFWSYCVQLLAMTINCWINIEI